MQRGSGGVVLTPGFLAGDVAGADRAGVSRGNAAVADGVAVAAGGRLFGALAWAAAVAGALPAGFAARDGAGAAGKTCGAETLGADATDATDAAGVTGNAAGPATGPGRASNHSPLTAAPVAATAPIQSFNVFAVAGGGAVVAVVVATVVGTLVGTLVGTAGGAAGDTVAGTLGVAVGAASGAALCDREGGRVEPVVCDAGGTVTTVAGGSVWPDATTTVLSRSKSSATSGATSGAAGCDALNIRRRSVAKAAAVSYRSSGCLASARDTMASKPAGTDGLTCEGGTGSSCTILR